MRFPRQEYWSRVPLPSPPSMLLEISGEITPKRMKRWSQSKKQNPVVNVIGDVSKLHAVKRNVA